MCLRWINEAPPLFPSPTELLSGRCFSLSSASCCSASSQAAKLNAAPASCWRWEPWSAPTLPAWVWSAGCSIDSAVIDFNCFLVLSGCISFVRKFRFLQPPFAEPGACRRPASKWGKKLWSWSVQKWEGSKIRKKGSVQTVFTWWSCTAPQTIRLIWSHSGGQTRVRRPSLLIFASPSIAAPSRGSRYLSAAKTHSKCLKTAALFDLFNETWARKYLINNQC